VTTTTDISIPKLRLELNGHVVAPGDAEYDGARTVFYGGFDRRPAVIVMAADAADVARVIELARETGLELAVRSGGHSVPGHSTTEGGIVLDLRDLNGLEIGVDSRTAWAETGLTTGGYTDAAAEHGLATPFGDTGSVGIGGAHARRRRRLSRPQARAHDRQPAGRRRRHRRRRASARGR
jgi:FAD/FMN-containing dehydrogenase